MARKKRVVLDPTSRRDQLLRSAVKVFSKKGYRHASISHIIAEAGVARGTFYLYFESKEQVFRAIVDAFHALVRQRLELNSELPDIGTDARASLAGMFTEWLSLFAAQRDAARVVLRDAPAIDVRFEKGYADLRRAALAHLRRRVSHLQDLGLVRATLDPHVVALIQLGSLDETVRARILDDAAVDIPPLVEALTEIHWAGLGPD